MGDVCLRWRRCLCGVEFRTEETIVRASIRLPAVTGNARQRRATLGNGPQPPATAPNPPQLGGGVGGGLSSGSDSPLFPASSGPSEQSGSSLGSDLRSDHAKEPQYTPAFVRFWAAYPKKKSKGDAWKAWPRAAAYLEAILAALEWQRASADWTKEGGKYIPHPASWLNDRCWEDEPTKVLNGTSTRDITRGWAPAMTGHPKGEQKL